MLSVPVQVIAVHVVCIVCKVELGGVTMFGVPVASDLLVTFLSTWFYHIRHKTHVSWPVSSPHTINTKDVVI